MRSGSKIRAFRNIVHAGFGHSLEQTKSATGASLTRRRAIRIVAAVAGLPLVIAAVRAAAPPGQLFSWQGEVLGALSELTLWHSDGAFDISVQPLWRLYEAHFWSHSDIQPDIEARARDVARDLVDFRNIDIGD